MIEIKTNDILTLLKFTEENQEVVNKLDYQFNRYNIKYTVCLIELSDEVVSENLNLKNYLRNTDEIVNIDEKYKFIFFVHADLDNAYKALLSLERSMIKFHFPLFQDSLFKAFIVEKKKSCIFSKMVKLLANLLSCNRNSDNQYIFTEEC